ncbi:MFS transporter [Catellatospora sp. NPDC049609]|uniref:MFS transporter n=1 Tax=Catellatospora sp. NPDC049609 TaxID=3155505 RepID=UPI00343E56CE
MGLRDNLIPPPGLPRRLAVQSVFAGTGYGTFLTGSAVFFTRVVGLRPHEIGIGLSLAAAIALVTAVPMSSLADRFGAQRMWVVGAVLQGLLFAAWPFARGFWSFLLVIACVEIASTIGQAGRNVYLIEALEPETRVRTQAFSRSYLNVGWSVGAGLAALALAIDTRPAYYALVLVNSVILLLNAWLSSRLPAVARAAARAGAGRRREVFRDRPFLAVTAVCAVLTCYMTVFMEVAPLWLLTHTDAPKWWLGVMTVTNTLMATTMQVALTRSAHTLGGAAAAMRRAGLVAALGCPVYLLAGVTAGTVTMTLLLVATVLLTLAEMWQSAGAWTVVAELAPPDRRGEYQGAFRMGGSAQSMIAPAALIALAVTSGGWGWLAVSAMFVGAALLIGPAMHRAAHARPEMRSVPVQVPA